MGDEFYDAGTGLEIPGLEALLEYGDASTMHFDRIPGALAINDQSRLEKIRVSQLDGLHDDPEGRSSSQPNADRHGESAGQMLYGGRTIGMTGRVEAGNLAAMRDWWGKLRRTFGVGQRDLLVYPRNVVPALTNELVNPSPKDDAFGWDYLSTATTSGPIGGVTDGALKVGSMSVVTAGADATLIVQDVNVPWAGEDVFVFARVKVHASSGAIASVALALREHTLVSPGYSHFDVVSQSAPAVGTWYTLAVRLPRAAMHDQSAASLGFTIRVSVAGARTYELRFSRCMLVLVRAGALDPPGYFDGDTPGFEWHGVARRSKSVGPGYAVNQVSDSALSSIAFNAAWELAPMTGLTAFAGPFQSSGFAGETTDRSVYFKVRKDNNATSRAMELTPAGPRVFDVQSGRTYRWSARLNVLQKPATGNLVMAVVWSDQAASVISTVAGSVIRLGVSNAFVEATAPTGAVSATIYFGVAATTTALATLEAYVADPCFVDISDFDPGSFAGVGEESDEVATTDGAHRRIPRPFLVRRVRKTSDMKAPEQQATGRSWRDFTMSLRAADPRVYAVDERRRQVQLTGTPKFVVRQSPDDFTLESGTLPVPTGWTYEGNFVTHPGTGSPFVWSRDAWNDHTGLKKHPNGGVGPKAWILPSGALGSNRPASNLSTRMYRSAEGFTYTNPRVVLGCAPSGFGVTSLSSNPGAFNLTVLSSTLYSTFSTILLKRVSGSEWVELRWSATSNAYNQAAFAGTITGTTYAFELWCSHNSSGSAAETRLATWDYQSYDSTSGTYPFLPGDQPMYLVSWMLSNEVFWELWSTYPSPIDFSGRIESGSFTLPSGLVPVVGSAVAGHVGHDLMVHRAGSQFGFDELVNHPPFVHYFESSDASLPPVSMSIPIIGTIDTPQVIQLRGDMVDPVVSISVPEYDVFPARTSVARFTGTIQEANPITVDLGFDAVGDEAVFDSFGNNAFPALLPGSDFAALHPGINYVTVQAKSWGDYSAHVLTSWRDALR